MAMLSIPSYKTDDPNYRYKMPRLVAKVEGRGNGIRTNICNMAEIARALKIPPDYTTRFCGSELGAQSRFDQAEGKAIITGAHEQYDLQSLIDKFIEKFVLCRRCQLPEIDLVVKKSRVEYRCHACGEKGEVDNQHRLAAYIIKNPPTNATSAIGYTPKKQSKHDRRLAKLSKSQPEELGQVEEKKKSSKKKSSKSKGKDEDDEHDDLHNTSDNKSSTTEIDAEVVPKKKSSSKKSKSKQASSKTKHVEDEDSSDEESDQYNSSGIKYWIRSMINTLCQIDQDYDDDDEEKDDTKCTKKSKASPDGAACSANSSETIPNLEVSDIPVQEDENVFQKNNKQVDTHSTSSAEKKPYTLDASVITTEKFMDSLHTYRAAVQCSDKVITFFVALESLFCKELGGLAAFTLDDRLKYLKDLAKMTTSEDILAALQDFLFFNANTDVVPEGYKAYASILYGFYNLDMLGESDIVEFYARPKMESGLNKRHSDTQEAFDLAKEAAQPFIKWISDKDEED